MMMKRIVEPFVQPDATEARAPFSPGTDAARSVRNASLTAGVGILLIAVLAGFGNFVAIQGLVTRQDAAKTARDVLGSEGMFRLGIASLLLVVALDVVVAWALYRVFNRVSSGMAMLAALFRLVYAGVFLVAISRLISALHLLSSDSYLAVFTPAQVRAEALSELHGYNDIWAAGLVLFGLHLLVVGYLAYRSGYIPRLLGVLLAVAGLGYLIDTFGTVLSRGSWTEISSVTFIGEFLLAVWLVIWGRRIPSGGPALPDTRAG
jgi:Domain of unknown function (DUF4386)